jgi:hypothetical protein
MAVSVAKRMAGMGEARSGGFASGRRKVPTDLDLHRMLRLVLWGVLPKAV